MNDTGSRSNGRWPHVDVRGALGRARAEWRHSNDAGAYASSTVAGMHTRRAHGLLVAPWQPLKEPADSYVFVSHVDASVTLAESDHARGHGSTSPSSSSSSSGPSSAPSSGSRTPRWDLAKHQFPGVDPTATPFFLQRFQQDPLPRWTHAVAGGELEVTLGLVRGAHAVTFRYLFRGPTPVTLSLRPLLATRSQRELLAENGGMLQRVELRRCDDDIDGSVRGAPTGEMRVQPRRDLPRVCFRYEGTFVGSPDWWRRFEYLSESDHGVPFQEDLWTPGIFEVRLHETPRYLVAAVDHLPSGSPAALLEDAASALLLEDRAEQRNEP